MGPVVICTTCQNRIAFSKLVSVRLGAGRVNTFICPCCSGDNFDVRHLEPKKRAA